MHLVISRAAGGNYIIPTQVAYLWRVIESCHIHCFLLLKVFEP